MQCCNRAFLFLKIAKFDCVSKAYHPCSCSVQLQCSEFLDRSDIIQWSFKQQMLKLGEIQQIPSDREDWCNTFVHTPWGFRRVVFHFETSSLIVVWIDKTEQWPSLRQKEKDQSKLNVHLMCVLRLTAFTIMENFDLLKCIEYW